MLQRVSHYWQGILSEFLLLETVVRDNGS